MTTRTRLAVLFFLALGLVTLPACGDEGATPTGGNEGQESADDGHDHDHDHDHEGPHGGHVLELGDHAAHLELLLDHDTKVLTVHVLDGDMKPMTVQQPPLLNFMHADQPVQLKGTRKNDGATWTYTHEAFEGEPKARLTIDVAGKAYTPTLDYGHHDHDHDHDHDDHEDHDHDGDGDDHDHADHDEAGTGS